MQSKCWVGHPAASKHTTRHQEQADDRQSMFGAHNASDRVSEQRANHTGSGAVIGHVSAAIAKFVESITRPTGVLYQLPRLGGVGW